MNSCIKCTNNKNYAMIALRCHHRMCLKCICQNIKANKQCKLPDDQIKCLQCQEVTKLEQTENNKIRAFMKQNPNILRKNSSIKSQNQDNTSLSARNLQLQAKVTTLQKQLKLSNQKIQQNLLNIKDQQKIIYKLSKQSNTYQQIIKQLTTSLDLLNIQIAKKQQQVLQKLMSRFSNISSIRFARFSNQSARQSKFSSILEQYVQQYEQTSLSGSTQNQCKICQAIRYKLQKLIDQQILEEQDNQQHLIIPNRNDQPNNSLFTFMTQQNSLQQQLSQIK